MVQELARLLELPEGFLPPIVESGSVIGTLAEEIRTEFSLPPVKVIASAGHDTQCAMAATPAEGHMERLKVFPWIPGGWISDFWTGMEICCRIRFITGMPERPGCVPGWRK